MAGERGGSIYSLRENSFSKSARESSGSIEDVKRTHASYQTDRDGNDGFIERVDLGPGDDETNIRGSIVERSSYEDNRQSEEDTDECERHEPENESDVEEPNTGPRRSREYE